MTKVTDFMGKDHLNAGGTGSYGDVVLSCFLHWDVRDIRIFSRDKKKQDDMRYR